MRRREYLHKIKTEQKDRALKIRELKLQRKPVHRPNGLSQNDVQYDLDGLRWDFRHQHIAYCLLRGKTREVIENPAADNRPNESIIQSLLNDYEQTVRISQD